MAAEMKHGPIALIDSDDPNSSKGFIFNHKINSIYYLISLLNNSNINHFGRPTQN